VFTNLVSFAGTNGATPIGSLVQGDDARFYGVTQGGGAYGDGTVFQMGADGSLATLGSLTGTNGQLPHAGLAYGPDGNFYGTTSLGGAYNQGTVFKITRDGTLTTLVSFDSTNGSSPLAELVLGADGNFYSTTEYGGASTPNWNNGCGTVFRMSLAGEVTTLLFFLETNGANPWGPLVQAPDGNFYGTTRGGGAFTNLVSWGTGTLFKLTPAGALTTILSFDGTNGDGSIFGLVAGADGALYGTSWGGQYQGLGNVFRLALDGTFTTIFSFNGTNGSYPRGLVRARDGNFYGVTGFGGVGYNGQQNSGHGTVFQLTPSGALTTLVFFTGNESPFGGLIEGTDGNLYGTTRGGGAYGQGAVFRLTVPMAPVFQSAGCMSGKLNLSWSAVTGLTYQVQYREGLEQPGWTNLGLPLTATNGIVVAADSIGPGPQRFYRVALLP
jgi:uncharacterized repeat protein (TIGR03803 family)